HRHSLRQPSPGSRRASENPPGILSSFQRRVSRREMLSAASGAIVAAAAGGVVWKLGFGSPSGDQRPVLTSPSPTPSPSSAQTNQKTRITPQSSPEERVAESAASTPSASDMVEETGIAEIKQALDDGHFTIAEYVQAALDRIEAMDEEGPWL